MERLLAVDGELPLAHRTDCNGNELVFLTYFTTLRLTVFVRRCTVLVRQRGKEERRKSFTELHLICISIWARCFQI